MNKITFIIPYFGHFNNYFELFLRSCGANKDVADWLIFTNDKTAYHYPENVKVTYMTWKEMQDLVKEKTGFRLERPYKLCDFKPSYGIIFRQYIEGYEFWGHCDTDLIWGDIHHFLTVDILDNYDKIFDLGHCTLYRNCDEMNTLFMHPLNGRERYKEVYSNSQNVSFDEEYRDSVNNICLQDGVELFDKSFAANTYMKTSNFRLTFLNKDRHTYRTEKKNRSFFYWKNGQLIRYIVKDGKWIKEDFMYIHFQSRPMDNKVLSPEIATEFKIIPNSFEPLEVSTITKETINKIRPSM